MATILKREKGTHDGWRSYLIRFDEGIELWFDIRKGEDGEYEGDWNQFVFHHDNEEDMRAQAFMNAHSDEAGAYNYMTAFETAERAYEEDEEAGA